MTLEVWIQTEPNKPKKRATLDSSLRGSNNPEPNFLSLFGVYKNSHKVYGTKADTIYIDGFLEEAFSTVELDYLEFKNEISAYMSQKFNYFMKEDGMWIAFWNNISEVHHRDIQAFAFGELAQSLARYAMTIAEKKGEIASKIDSLAAKLKETVEQIYEIKVRGGVAPSDISLLAIKYSQGFQISSEDEDLFSDMWKSRITKIQMHSSCVKDQRKYGLAVDETLTVFSIETLLGNIYDVEYATPYFAVANTHEISRKSFTVDSIRLHKKSASTRDAYQPRFEQKELRVVYIPP